MAAEHQRQQEVERSKINGGIVQLFTVTYSTESTACRQVPKPPKVDNAAAVYWQNW